MQMLVPAIATAALLLSSAAFAQSSATPPASAPSMQAPTGRLAPVQTPPVLSEAEARALIDAAVVSSDAKSVGEVAAIQRSSDGKVVELHADVGGFLGLGQSRVRLAPSQSISNNRVLLTLTAQQVSELPKIEK